MRSKNSDPEPASRRPHRLRRWRSHLDDGCWDLVAAVEEDPPDFEEDCSALVTADSIFLNKGFCPALALPLPPSKPLSPVEPDDEKRLVKRVALR